MSVPASSRGDRQPPHPTNGRGHWLMDLWNESAHPSLPRCLRWTEALSVAAKKRVEELPDRADWAKAIAMISESEFCLGKNERGWRASLRWLIERREAVHKALEGVYASGPKRKRHGE